MHISYWSAVVCASDLSYPMDAVRLGIEATVTVTVEVNADGSPVIVETTYEISDKSRSARYGKVFLASATEAVKRWKFRPELVAGHVVPGSTVRIPIAYCLRSEEHTSELPSLMRTSYAVCRLKKKTKHKQT